MAFVDPGRDLVAGIVLAAGTSSRFGSPKQLLDFDGAPLLERVVANATASALDRVVVVLGSSAEEIRAAVKLGRARVADNREFGAGCASSLKAGLAAAKDLSGLMLLLGDQPGVGPAIIDRVLDAWRRDRPWAAVSGYRGALGHPFVFSSSAFEELGRLRGDKAIWGLIERLPERIARIELDLELPPDIDTPADFERALGHWRNARRDLSC